MTSVFPRRSLHRWSNNGYGIICTSFNGIATLSRAHNHANVYMMVYRAEYVHASGLVHISLFSFFLVSATPPSSLETQLLVSPLSFPSLCSFLYISACNVSSISFPLLRPDLVSDVEGASAEIPVSSLLWSSLACEPECVIKD